MDLKHSIKTIALAILLGAGLFESTPLQAVIFNRFVTQEAVLEKARPMSNVVAVKTSWGNGSGILISPRHVLTINHVGNTAASIFAYPEVVLTDKQGVQETRIVKQVISYEKNPEVYQENALAEPIAILILDEDVDTDRFPPATLYRGSIGAFCGYTRQTLYGVGCGEHLRSDSKEADESLTGSRVYYETQVTYYRDDVRDSIQRCKRMSYMEQMNRNQYSFLGPSSYEQLERSIETSWSRYSYNTIMALSKNLSGWESKVDLYDIEFEGAINGGDSGSPLFSPEGEVVAIARAGVNHTTDSDNYIPGVTFGSYTPVAPYVEWIEDVLENHPVAEDEPSMIESLNNSIEELLGSDSIKELLSSNSIEDLLRFVYMPSVPFSSSVSSYVDEWIKSVVENHPVVEEESLMLD